MRLSPSFPSLASSNTTAKASTQGSPSSPSQNARSGLLLNDVPINGTEGFFRLPTGLQLDKAEFVEKLADTFKSSLKDYEWDLLQQAIKEAESHETKDVIFREVYEGGKDLHGESHDALILSQNGKESSLITRKDPPNYGYAETALPPIVNVQQDLAHLLNAFLHVD